MGESQPPPESAMPTDALGPRLISGSDLAKLGDVSRETITYLIRHGILKPLKRAKRVSSQRPLNRARAVGQRFWDRSPANGGGHTCRLAPVTSMPRQTLVHSLANSCRMGRSTR